MDQLLGLAQQIAARLKARGETVAVAESSAGGLIAAALLAVPGASAYFLGGAVVYTRQARRALMAITDDAMAGLRPSSEPYAALLARPVTVVRKTRVSGETVRAEDLVGDVEGRSALIVDDMISTGGTIEAAAQVLRRHGVSGDIAVTATHGLLVPPAPGRLAAVVSRLVVTDTLPSADHPELHVDVQSVAALLADAIGRLHGDEDLADLTAPG